MPLLGLVYLGLVVIMGIRKTFFWLHLIIGCAAAIFIFLMSITGVALTYERQIIKAAERADYPQVQDAVKRLSLEQVLVIAKSFEVKKKLFRFRGGSDSASATSLIGQLQSLKATVGEPKLVGLLQQNTALRENVEELERLLRHTLDGPDANGLSRLHVATIEQDAERCESLLRAGADPEVKAGSVAVRPLHLAVLAGDQSTGCLRSLLRAGAKPNARDSRGTTALHAAAALNLPHTASLLLEYGASPRLRGARGVRPLQLAGAGNAAETAQVLLSAGAEVDATDARGRTASHAAAANDASEVLELLHESGADLEAHDRKGWTPLHHAVRACRCTDPLCGRTRALQYLLGPVGCAALPRDRAGWTPLL